MQLQSPIEQYLEANQNEHRIISLRNWRVAQCVTRFNIFVLVVELATYYMNN